MPVNDYYQSLRDSQAATVRTNQTAQLAEMGAAQLERYGQPGQVWAQRLRQNPRAALAMAEQYGGFQQIEAGFQYAESNRRGATADSLVRQGLELGGPSAAKDISSAFQSTQTGQRKIIEGADGFKYYADTGERVLEDVEKSKDRRDLAKDVLGRQVFVDTGETVVDAERSMTMPRQEIQKRYERRSTDFKPNLVTLRRWEQNKNLPAGPPGDFSRLQILGKMLDDSSVVREGEAELMRTMGAATAIEAFRKMRVWEKTGLFTQAARDAVSMAIEATYIANAKRALQQSDSWDAENEALGMNAKEKTLSLPYQAEIEQFRKSVKDAEGSLTVEQFEAGLAFFSRLGVDREDITQEMVVDVIESMELEDGGQASTPPPRQAGGPRPLTMQDMQAMMKRGQ